MRHKWTSAVLALLLAGLMCFSLTGCELEEEATDPSGDNTTVSVSTDQVKKEYVKDSDGKDTKEEQWVLTRTYSEDYVADRLQTSKNINYCLEQAEVVATASTNPEIKQVSLLYALDAKTYFYYLEKYLEENDAENGLTKKADTEDRRYVLITFDYEWCTHEESHGEEPIKVTIQYGTETSKAETISNKPWTTACTMTSKENSGSSKNEIVYVEKSGYDLTEYLSSYTTRQVMNAALRLVLGQTAENTSEDATIKTNFVDNLFDLAVDADLVDDAKDLANKILLDTKDERNAM
jgi:hypothetical protein